MMKSGGPAPVTFPIIFAAPSGAGKTTLARRLAERRGDIRFSISVTTRSPRARELDGRDYFFRSEEDFRAMIAAGELLEWAEVHGNFYGTPRRNLEEARANNHFLVLDIDVQGSRQVKRAVPEAVSIFMLPPSGAELARRLIGRATEAAEVRRRRLLAARAEIAAASEFDYVVVNDDLDSAVARIESIIVAEQARTSRQDSLASFTDLLVRQIDAALDG